MSFPGLNFRSITPEDQAFLFQVYASTRLEELAVTHWTHEELEAFLNMQFHAQHTYYQEHFADSSFDMILLHGQPVGRLYVARWETEIRIIDIALLPEYRNQGLGRALLQDLLDEASAHGKMVSIHVEKNNPALRLYKRLGFGETADSGVYWFMKWLPPALAPATGELEPC
jgi:ribosomal protein S18 acetylase RimI-like enzyme